MRYIVAGLALMISTSAFAALDDCFVGAGGKVDHKKEYPLHYAVMKNNLRDVKRYVRQGYDVNAADREWGTTPLGYAISTPKDSKIEIARFLISEAGADVDAATRNCDGDIKNSTLKEAAFYGCLQCVKMLIEFGADVFWKDEHGRSAFDVSERTLWVAEETFKNAKNTEGTEALKELVINDAVQYYRPRKAIYDYLRQPHITPEYVAQKQSALEQIRKESVEQANRLEEIGPYMQAICAIVLIVCFLIGRKCESKIGKTILWIIGAFFGMALFGSFVD